MKTDAAVRALAALAQASRLAAFRLLVTAGEAGLPAGEIAQRLGASPATLSFHLKELLNAGLVTARQDGRFVIYTAHYAQMDALLAFLTDNCCGGEPCAPSPRRGAARRTARMSTTTL